MRPMSPEKSESYRTGAAMLLLAAAVIIAALLFEHVGGYRPCEVCLMQRWSYYLGIPALFAALVVLSAEHPKAAAALFLLVALGFLANACIGVWQAGFEWQFWPGPDACTGTFEMSAKGGLDLLKRLGETTVVRCDQPSFRMFGLSFAGWNAVISAILFFGCAKAAFAVRDPESD
jgi:disulfide bond formation protein DsbB